jgi:curved DNA-binding protein CbpA
MPKENRRFKRYTTQASLTLTLEGHNYIADIVDYSFDGICAVVKDSPPVNEGDIVIIDLENYCVKCSGKIIWVSTAADGLRLGVHREGLLYASLEDFFLADILLGLQRISKTGEFHIISNTVHKTIYLKSGDINFASSNQTTERFGGMLLREKAITPEGYRKAQDYMKIRSGTHRLGTALMELGFIRPEALEPMIRKHVEGIILSLFELQEGEFMFKEAPLTIEETITLNLSTANLIYRGITSLNDENYLKRLCPPENTVLYFSEDPLDLFQDLKLEDTDKKILASIDGKKAIKDIVNGSPLKEFETLKSLYAFLSTRIVGIKEYSGEPQVEIPVEEVIKEEAPDVTSNIVEEIEHLHKNYRELGYYGIMGLDKSALESEIKTAYYKKAKDFHPDRHFDLPGDMKSKLNDIFTYITTAYSTLINSDIRREYDLKGEENPMEVDNAKLALQKFESGKIKYQKGNFVEAKRLFSEAAYLDSSVANYHFYTGMALLRTDKNKDAERAMRRALKSEPFNPDFLAEAGHVFISLGFPLRAKGHFEKALKISPNQKRAMEGMSKIR